MMRKSLKSGFYFVFIVLVALVLFVSCFAVKAIFNKNITAANAASEVTLTIDPTQSAGASKNGIHDVSDTLYGIFFEDINHAADGGMSAEMVANQSFEFYYIDYANKANGFVDDFFRYWLVEKNSEKYATREVKSGSGAMDTEKNPNYLQINAKIPGYKLVNPGFRGDNFHDSSKYNNADYGMSFVSGNQYEFSVYLKNNAQKPYSGDLKIYAKDFSGTVITDTQTIDTSSIKTDSWTKFTAMLTANKTDLGGLIIEFSGIGTLEIDFVSLMPTDSYGYNDPRYTGGKIKNEYIQLFEDMQPKFLRFPGGCVAEGDVGWRNVYNWKNTVGALEQRIGTSNTWEYWQSYNIGFYEYFLLCEDLNMKAMPVVSAGLICQGRMGDEAVIFTPDDDGFFDEVVRQTVHLIYFAKGDVNSADPEEKEWATLRQSMGHTKPFNLDYVSLGNENWGEEYWTNFAAAMASLKSYDYGTYENSPVNILTKWGIQIVTTSGVRWDGAEFDLAWRKVNGASTSSATANGLYKDLMVDEHYYNTAAWYRNNVGRYDTYDRNGASVFVGEYAANNGNAGVMVNDLEAALAEAAFMTGLERNSDIVKMASIAPFFGREGNSNWMTNAVWFNAKNIMKTPNYYVQQMFSENVGNIYIPTKLSSNLSGVYTSITADKSASGTIERIYLKVVNTSNASYKIGFDTNAVANARSYYFGKTMQNDDQTVKNTLADAYDGAANEPLKPTSIEKTELSNGFTAKKYSVSVLVIPCGAADSDSSLTSIRTMGQTIEVTSGKVDYVVEVPENACVPYLFADKASKTSNCVINYATDITKTTTITVTADSGAVTTYNITYKQKATDNTGEGTGGGNTKGGCGGCGSKITQTTVLPIISVLAIIGAVAVLLLLKRKQKNK